MTALVNAPLVMACGLTLLVPIVSAPVLPDAWSVFQKTGSAALVYSSTLITFSLVFGSIGAGLLTLADTDRPFAWAATGALLGIIAAMMHGIALRGIVGDIEMAVAAVLSAALFLLIRLFALPPEAWTGADVEQEARRPCPEPAP